MFKTFPNKSDSRRDGSSLELTFCDALDLLPHLLHSGLIHRDIIQQDIATRNDQYHCRKFIMNFDFRFFKQVDIQHAKPGQKSYNCRFCNGNERKTSRANNKNINRTRFARCLSLITKK